MLNSTVAGWWPWIATFMSAGAQQPAGPASRAGFGDAARAIAEQQQQ
jgi:hypothetical protein